MTEAGKGLTGQAKIDNDKSRDEAISDYKEATGMASGYAQTRKQKDMLDEIIRRNGGVNPNRPSATEIGAMDDYGKNPFTDVNIPSTNYTGKYSTPGCLWGSQSRL